MNKSAGYSPEVRARAVRWVFDHQGTRESRWSASGSIAARFGEAHFRSWDGTCAFFTGPFVAGLLGGARIVARRSGLIVSGMTITHG